MPPLPLMIIIIIIIIIIMIVVVSKITIIRVIINNDDNNINKDNDSNNPTKMATSTLKKKKKGKITQRTNTCLCKPSSEKFKTLPYFNLMMCMVLLWYDIDFTGLFVNGKRLQIFQPHVSLT